MAKEVGNQTDKGSIFISERCYKKFYGKNKWREFRQGDSLSHGNVTHGLLKKISGCKSGES
jgi:hypothetical protein